MSELYNRIDQICKARGTNITALCKKAGVGRATLSELNAGRTKTLTLETARKLADALEVSINFLQGDFTDGNPIRFRISTEELSDYISKQKKEPTPVSESEPISAERQALLDAIKDMDDDTARAVLEVVRSVKKLRGE